MKKEKNKQSNNKSIIVIIISLILVLILMMFFPKINDFITELSMPKVEPDIKEEEPPREITEDILETIHYPLMRNSIYNQNTYYSLDKFTVSDMTNTDILLNGFLSIESVMIKPTGTRGSCVAASYAFDTKWIDFRIKNILGKTVKYNFENFYVPEDINSNYKGIWTYDITTNKFIYNGLCQSVATPTTYYDLTKLIKLDYVDEESTDIDAYYYVGFAKVEGNNYIIYSDTAMQNEVTNGTITNPDELKVIFENLDTNTLNKFKKYKYTFKDTLCSYNEYCLYEGKWVNE